MTEERLAEIEEELGQLATIPLVAELVAEIRRLRTKAIPGGDTINHGGITVNYGPPPQPLVRYIPVPDPRSRW